MRVLVVDDDRVFCDFVQSGLSAAGFVVDVAESGEDALSLSLESPYDGILLDVLLPRKDGFQTLKTLRNSGWAGAAIFLSGQNSELDKLKAFEVGADDYVAKPFLLTELIARIRAITRRTQEAARAKNNSNALKAGPLVVDVNRYEAKSFGKPVTLTKKEFDLLEYLMRRPGQIFSQEMLTQRLNGANHLIGSNSIEVHMSNLRSKLNRRRSKNLIRTIRGRGYMLDV